MTHESVTLLELERNTISTERRAQKYQWGYAIKHANFNRVFAGKIVWPSVWGFYTVHDGFATPEMPGQIPNSSWFMAFTNKIATNGTHTLEGNFVPGVIYDVHGDPVDWTRVITDPEIQEGVAWCMVDSDTHFVTHGSWEDGEIIVKRHHSRWSYEGRKPIPGIPQYETVELYPIFKEMYDKGRIHKATLETAIHNKARIRTYDKKLRRRMLFKIQRPPIYEVILLPDHGEEMHWRFI